MNLAIVAISLDCYKSPGAFLPTLTSLINQRKILFASNSKMRSIFRQIYDDQDAFMVCFRELLNLVRNESLHVDLDDELPVELRLPCRTGVVRIKLTKSCIFNSKQ